MPKKQRHPLALQVRLYDGFFRRQVHSEYGPQKAGEPDWYLVDLDSYEGNGKCGCWRFENVLEPLVRDKKLRRRCKHIRAARAEVGRELLDAVLVLRAKEARKIRDEI